jgi:hypothetical protein
MVNMLKAPSLVKAGNLNVRNRSLTRLTKTGHGLPAYISCGEDGFLPRDMVITITDEIAGSYAVRDHLRQYGEHNLYTECGAWCGVDVEEW